MALGRPSQRGGTRAPEHGPAGNDGRSETEPSILCRRRQHPPSKTRPPNGTAARVRAWPIFPSSQAARAVRGFFQAALRAGDTCLPFELPARPFQTGTVSAMSRRVAGSTIWCHSVAAASGRWSVTPVCQKSRLPRPWTHRAGNFPPFGLCARNVQEWERQGTSVLSSFGCCFTKEQDRISRSHQAVGQDANSHDHTVQKAAFLQECGHEVVPRVLCTSESISPRAPDASAWMIRTEEELRSLIVPQHFLVTHRRLRGGLLVPPCN